MNRRKNPLLPMAEALGRILKQYSVLQRQHEENAYRLVDIKQNKSGNVKLTVQIVGKNVTFIAKPEKLAANDKILNQFSREDVRTITYFACQETKKPKYKILLHEFCDVFNKMIFSLRGDNNEKYIQKTAEEISEDKELLAQLSQEDAHLIGYAAGKETAAAALKEKEEIDNIIKPNYEITDQEQCEAFNRMVFTVKQSGTEKVQQKTAEELTNNKEIVKGLNQEDALKVGYAAGKEHNDKE